MSPRKKLVLSHSHGWEREILRAVADYLHSPSGASRRRIGHCLRMHKHRLREEQARDAERWHDQLGAQVAPVTARRNAR